MRCTVMGKWGYRRSDVTGPFDSSSDWGDTSSSEEDKAKARSEVLRRYEAGLADAKDTKTFLDQLGLLE